MFRIDMDENSGDKIDCTSTSKVLSHFSQVIDGDDGNSMIKVETAESCVFHISFKSDDDVEMQSRQVYSDSRADDDTVYKNMFHVLKRCPSITLNRSKIIIPMFFRFLNDQYYAVFGAPVRAHSEYVAHRSNREHFRLESVAAEFGGGAGSSPTLGERSLPVQLLL